MDLDPNLVAPDWDDAVISGWHALAQEAADVIEKLRGANCSIFHPPGTRKMELAFDTEKEATDFREALRPTSVQKPGEAS